VFFSFFSAGLLLTLLYSGAIPPLVVKTKGLNDKDFSMSITLWLYLFFFCLFEHGLLCMWCVMMNGSVMNSSVETLTPSNYPVSTLTAG